MAKIRSFLIVQDLGGAGKDRGIKDERDWVRTIRGTLPTSYT